MLAFLSRVDRVPEAHTLHYLVPTDFVVAIPAKQASRILVTCIRAFAFGSKDNGGNKHLSQPWKRPVQVLFMYSASLLPWPPSSLWSSRCRWQTVLLQGGVGQGIAHVLHSRITTSPCLLLQRAGSSLSWWMAFCHLQLTVAWGPRSPVPCLLPTGAGLASTDRLLCI